MSQMPANIGRIIDEDISSRVTQYNVIYEAITNAIIAKATEITCILNSTERSLEENGSEIVKRKVDSIAIKDNGEGFTDENFISFCTYRSDFNKSSGCKGIGRLLFLKVYDDVVFTSELVNEQEFRSFKFVRNFDTENLDKKSSNVVSNSTEIRLSNLTKQYQNAEKHVDRRIELDLDVIRENVLLHLIPTLFFFKKKGISINIEFIDSNSQAKSIISTSDIPDFKEKVFSVVDRDNKSNEFILNYWVENANGKLNAFYCGNNRTVCEFSEQDFRISLPYGYSGFFLLESEYLSSRVNNERNKFEIYPVMTDLFSSISWEMINTKLKSEIAEIVKEGIPDTKRINKEKLEKILAERLYLEQYIDDEDIEMAGFIDENKIIEKAKKRFDKAKEKVLKSSGKSEYTNTELQEAIQITQNELVSYINDRSQVLERLRYLVDGQEQVEKIIHNLFMEKNSTDDFFCIGKNNLWLIDDRFTSYSYAASDKRIRDVLSAIDETNDDVDILDDRPDLSLFFSHNPHNFDSLKAVMVEIKPFDFSAKPDRKKFAGIQQVADYVRAFKDKEKIDEIFGFVITDIDDKLAERLKNDSYIPLFSTASPIFHRFYPDGISIYVISAKTLIADAEARNKIFLDIVRKQSKLHNFLGRENLETKKTTVVV